MTCPLLDKIITLENLKKLDVEELKNLSNEIRTKIIKTLSTNGGHLSSNLGIVELTVALHYVFNSPQDKFIFDTGHQTYTHKLLTDRKKDFNTLRQLNGLSGFSYPPESPHDHFYSGHAGAAFSIALGLAQNRDLTNEKYHILPVLGDASFTCGLTYEALNNIPKDLKRLIVILNDNEMAISQNVGNIKQILSRLINNPKVNKLYLDIENKLSKIPNFGSVLAQQSQKLKEAIKHLVSSASFFEHFGFTYIGPIDGHDIKKLTETLSYLKNMEKPVLLHVITTKGKGLPAAKENPTYYHGVKPFNIENGKFLDTKTKTTFPKIFGSHILKLAEKDPSIFVLSPAMLSGSSLTNFKNKFPTRCLDVGIAEGHCVTFAGGLAYKKNIKPVVSIYSTFLQRAFDNLFHDVCLQKLPVIFTIDRAGLSGPDGATHHGIYDIGFLNAMPNMIITQPRNGMVLKELLESAFTFNAPTAIRYPNSETEETLEEIKPRKLGKGEILQSSEDKKILLISLGSFYKTALEISSILEKTYNIRPTIVDPVFLKPLDEDLFMSLLSSYENIITLEEHSLSCGLGSIINSFAVKNNLHSNQILNFGIDNTFVQHGNNKDLLKKLELDPESITKKIADKIGL